MANENVPCLVIQKGIPYKSGTCIALDSDEFVIGRGLDLPPYSSLVFEESYLSRKHLQITKKNGVLFAMDLDSKNGSSVNGRMLETDKEQQLNDGDTITLAENAVVLQVQYSMPLHLETPTLPTRARIKSSHLRIRYLSKKNEFHIDNFIPELSPKLFALFLLLYNKKPGNLLTYDEFKSAVWPEREFVDENGIPNVDSGEITRMVDRLRRKLGNYGHIVISRRGFGYMLDESCVSIVDKNE